jgi:uncharacterized membrane protein YhaH (DUF805 family)
MPEALDHLPGLRGRIGRKQFWLVIAKLYGLALALAIVGVLVRSEPVAVTIVEVISPILLFAYLVSAIVRRLHDQEITGWWLVVAIAVFVSDCYLLSTAFEQRPVIVKILIIGWHVVTCVLGLAGFGRLIAVPGTLGDNRFGSDPLGSHPKFSTTEPSLQ